MVDTRFQSSFIPKQPITANQTSPGHVSLFMLIGLVVFIITLGLWGASYIWESNLNASVKNLNNQLVEAKNSFELSTIDELKATNYRIDALKSVLGNHISFSKFFDYLNSNTYKNVYWSDFSYIKDQTGLKLVFSGSAQSFNTLNLQSEIFAGSPDTLSGVQFSDFTLNDDGSIKFKITANVNPSSILYKNQLN